MTKQSLRKPRYVEIDHLYVEYCMPKNINTVLSIFNVIVEDIDTTEQFLVIGNLIYNTDPVWFEAMNHIAVRQIIKHDFEITECYSTDTGEAINLELSPEAELTLAIELDSAFWDCFENS